MEHNLLNFKQAFNQLLESICVNALEHFPSELKIIFSYIRQSVTLKWPHDRNVRIYSISAFIFLRLICPTLMNLTTSTNTQLLNLQQQQQQQQSPSISSPSLIHLKTSLNTINERNIKLLTKALQTLANLTECKESFMLPLSEYLSTNRSIITKFIDKISNVDNQPLANPIIPQG